jgi:spore coat polysaccharide biosynthesis predicted glycosyltransferase SpsG
MGGSDIKNITYDVLQQLDSNFDIVVVLGSVSPHNVMIKNYAKDKNIEVIVNADNVAELMLEADLAIGAGGSTSWERCCLGLPTLLYVLADNQKVIAENLERSGAVIIVEDLKNNLQTVVNDFTMWQDMSNKGRYVCNGLGVKMVINVLEKLI